MSNDWDFIGDLSIVSNEETEKLKELFLSHKLDCDKVWGNYECFLRKYEGRLMTAFGGIENEKFITPSLEYFIHPDRTPADFPLWVYAAYPDVMIWYRENSTIDKKALIRDSQEDLIKFVGNLVSHYKFITNRELESSIIL